MKKYNVKCFNDYIKQCKIFKGNRYININEDISIINVKTKQIHILKTETQKNIYNKYQTV